MKTLKLNHSYHPLEFISWRRAIKLIVNDKVFIDSYWDNEISYNGGKSSFKHPSIIRLKYYVPFHIKKRRYVRTGVFKRDGNACQYCGAVQRQSLLTIDHIVPVTNGGKTTWENCVTSCHDCNNRKGDKTAKAVGMQLIKKPRPPKMAIWYEYILMPHKHPDWENYFPNSN